MSLIARWRWASSSGPAVVALGSAECAGDERSLMGLDVGDVEPGEVMAQIRIGEDALVEALHRRVDGAVAADPHVQRGRRGIVCLQRCWCHEAESERSSCRPLGGTVEMTWRSPGSAAHVPTGDSSATCRACSSLTDVYAVVYIAVQGGPEWRQRAVSLGPNGRGRALTSIGGGSRGERSPIEVGQ